MKIKDYIFKCVKYDRPDFDGYTGEMEVTTKDHIYIKGQKYCSKDRDKNSGDSKYGCRKALVEFIKKYEKEIEEDLLRVRNNKNENNHI
jgi:hypothetical protein